MSSISITHDCSVRICVYGMDTYVFVGVTGQILISSRCNPAGTTWEGKCWTFHEKLKYEFDFCFDIPVGYPVRELLQLWCSVNAVRSRVGLLWLLHPFVKYCSMLVFRPRLRRFEFLHSTEKRFAWVAASAPCVCLFLVQRTSCWLSQLCSLTLV